jgi:beta-lactamase regulating signal transducer with metallopeptidase domain
MHLDPMLSLLLRLTLLMSVALVLLAALRPLLRRAAGARATYAAWLLVPLMLTSPWLPPLALPVPAAVAPALAVSPSAAQPTPTASATMPMPSGLSVSDAVLLVWLTGCLGLAALMADRQHLHRQSLWRDGQGQWRSPAGHSPAVVGVWPARLVLPSDFEQRFHADTRRLMLEHEGVHLRRHDNAWNLLAAALLCLQWFNPLAWWGWHRLRGDQELACDETVLDSAPDPARRAAYGEALLMAHAGPAHPALASAWGSRHPLVHRVQWLARHRTRSTGRRVGGAALALGLGLGAALLARAAQEPPPPRAKTVAKTVAKTPHGLVLNIESQIGQGDWQHSELRLPLPPAAKGSPTGLSVQAMQPGWCLYVSLYAFGDGDVRPTVLAMDETCQRPLGEGRTLSADGSLSQFAAQTPQGALQAQVSARWMQAAEAAAAAQGDGASAPALSPKQQQDLANRRAEFARAQQQLAAQDKAWRAAREPQPGTR